uniref:Coatomer subunit beta n=1 Tax=Lygus hesperus TaxID=30085 RepID=A0A0A9WLF9_LYGHE
MSGGNATGNRQTQRGGLTNYTESSDNSANKGNTVELPQPHMKVTTTVREDGTYVTLYNTLPTSGDGGTASKGAKSTANENGSEDVIGLRAFIVNGQFFVTSSLASTVTKLIVRLHFNHHRLEEEFEQKVRRVEQKNVTSDVNV